MTSTSLDYLEYSDFKRWMIYKFEIFVFKLSFLNMA